eukprot:3599651-Rhodomonas_salina.1
MWLIVFDFGVQEHGRADQGVAPPKQGQRHYWRRRRFAAPSTRTVAESSRKKPLLVFLGLKKVQREFPAAAAAVVALACVLVLRVGLHLCWHCVHSECRWCVGPSF